MTETVSLYDIMTDYPLRYRYQQKIQKRLEDISKVKYCKELLDVVTQCEHFNINFDFETELVSKLGLILHT